MTTINYYTQNASAYVDDTQNVDMSELIKKFLSYLKPNAHILDAGCGSGRDALYFKRQGYIVTALEPCEELAQHTALLLEQSVHQITFQQIVWENQFDGIWACASLLHVPEKELLEVFQRLQRSLKHDGILYFSFKYGAAEREKEGRFFTDMNEVRFDQLLKPLPEIKIIKLWRTNDVRSNRAKETWLNGLIVKKQVEKTANE